MHEAAEIIEFPAFLTRQSTPALEGERRENPYAAVLATGWAAQCLVFRSIMWLFAIAYADFKHWANGRIVAWRLNSALVAWAMSGASWGVSLVLIAVIIHNPI